MPLKHLQSVVLEHAECLWTFAHLAQNKYSVTHACASTHVACAFYAGCEIILKHVQHHSTLDHASASKPI